MLERGESCEGSSTIVLVAALDEEKGIQLTLAELRHHLPNSKFLVVDGNSSDKTVVAAENQGAKVLHQKGKGKGDAIAFGLRNIDSEPDYVVFIDADYTYPSEFIPKMIRVLENNPEVGMVSGNRFNSHMHVGAMRDLFYIGNRLLAFAHNLMNGINLRDPLTGLRVVRGDIIINWEPKSSGFDIEVELNHHIERQGYTIMEVEIPYRERVGQKKLKLRHALPILNRIVTEGIRMRD